MIMATVNNKNRKSFWKIWMGSLKAFVIVCLIGSCVIPGITADPSFTPAHPGGQSIPGLDPLEPEPLKIGFSRYPYPPMHDYNADSDLIGFDIDLALAAAEIMDAEFVFVPINWSDKARLLASGEVDMLWGGLEVDSLDDQTILFTTSYLRSDIVLLMDKERNYNRFEDLEGLGVCALNYTPAFDCLQTYRNTLIKNRQSFTPTQYAELFRALSSGEYDCLITDVNFAAFFCAATGTEYKISDTVIPSSYAVAVRSDDTELLGRLQNALDRLIANGDVSVLKDKWINNVSIAEYGHTSGNAL
jgi:polar amino acid transport system substrate-binding protein